MKKILIILLFFAGVSTVCAQKQVYKVPTDSYLTLSNNAFCYMLPTTAVKVDVTVVKVREIKGYYAEDAEKLLGLTNIISENKTYYQLKDVSISTEVVPDPTQRYAVEPSPNQVKNGNHISSLFKHNQQSVPVVFEQSYTTEKTDIPDFYKNYANVSFTETEDAFVETKIINGVVTQVPANHTKIVNKTASQKVQEAADQITQIRKQRNTLIAGEQEIPYSDQTLRLMIDELNQAENNYLDLFRGISLKDEIHYTFLVTPTGDENDVNIFFFDSNHGFSTEATQEDNAYSLHFTPQMDNRYQLQQDPKKANNGYRIRTAIPVLIGLKHENTNHVFGIYPMLQWSAIKTLPANIDTNIEEIGFIY